MSRPRSEPWPLWVAAAIALAASIILSGCCFSRAKPPAPVAGGKDTGSTAVDGVLATVATWSSWSTWLGAAMLVAAAMVAVWAPAIWKARAWQIGIGGGALMAAGYCLAFLSDNSWIIALSILAVGLLAAWSGRKVIEKWLGIDIDGGGIGK